MTEIENLRAEILRLQSRPIGEQLRDIAATLASTGRAVDAVELIGMALRIESDRTLRAGQ